MFDVVVKEWEDPPYTQHFQKWSTESMSFRHLERCLIFVQEKDNEGRL